MKEVRKKSAAPIYAAAATWLFWGLILPLRRWWQFLLLILLSWLVYAVFSKIFPGETVQVETKIDTGDETLDAILRDERRYLASFEELRGKITDETVAGYVSRMSNALDKICDHIEAHPEKAKSIRKFMNYYLPTSEKLLKAYVEAKSQGIGGENIDATARSVENVLGTVADAFEHQLDALFANQAMDVSTDITVLENMLRAEGLAGKDNN